MFHNLSIRWKMLLLALVGPLLVAGILAWQRLFGGVINLFCESFRLSL
jgi:hypothetical protein